MIQTTLETPVGQLVAERPERARVFEQHGIDYCCGGKKTLERACAERSLDSAAIIAEIEASDVSREHTEEPNWMAANLGDLVEHIISTHHGYLKQELPRLSFLIEKVVRAHGERHPEMHDVARIFSQFWSEMELHMKKEETILFPMCLALESPHPRLRFHCGTINNPIHVMESEHEAAAQDLEQMRFLTSDYTPPRDACSTYRVLLDGLDRLEADTHQHVHKENNILFPRAAKIEAAIAHTSDPTT